MNLDLNTLLEGWPHEPGQIRVRRIRGIDGKEKIQLRIDLGLIQMEVEGRPDGVRPKGAASLLEWHRQQAQAAEAEGDPYVLTADDCAELQQESVQYYHRYLALFQLEDFKGVIRDTQYNLDLFNFVAKYADREDVAWSFEQFRPYVLMMNTRAKASMELESGRIAEAIGIIEQCRNAILQILHQRPEPTETSPEVQFLGEWLDELRSKRPLSKLETMQREMEEAIAAEAYERAAELRDAIRAFTEKGGEQPTAATATATASEKTPEAPTIPILAAIRKMPVKKTAKKTASKPAKTGSKPAKPAAKRVPKAAKTAPAKPKAKKTAGKKAEAKASAKKARKKSPGSRK